MEKAVSQIDSVISGNVDTRISCDEEGELYRLLHSVNTLAAICNAQIEKESKEKEGIRNTILDISHQLKTPLAALNIYNGILQEEAGEKEKRCMSEGANTLPEIDLQMWDMKSWNENAGNPMGLPDLHMKSKGSKELTEEYQKFKTAGTEGILGCKIRSIILPLLADHLLREANHYLRLLGEEIAEMQF